MPHANVYAETSGNIDSMGSRRVTLSDDAYERLDAERRPDESFSDVVLRLTDSDDLLDYVGVLDDEAADELEAAIDAARERRGRSEVEDAVEQQ